MKTSGKQIYRLSNFYSFMLLVVAVLGLCAQVYGQSTEQQKKELSIRFSGDAKIEVGSNFAGLSFHHSYPVPQRISFYYPSANSVDNSTDYWYRDTTFVMDIGIQFGEEKTEWLNKSGLTYDITPFSVAFQKKDTRKEISLSYQFTKEKPAFVISYTIKNLTQKPQQLTLYLRHALSVNTSHSYRRKEPASTMPSEDGKTTVARFNDGETQNPDIFYLSSSAPGSYQVIDKNRVNDTMLTLFPEKQFVAPPAINYIYTKSIQPGQSYILSEIIGSCRQGESAELCQYLHKNYQREVADFERSLLYDIYTTGVIKTGDSYLDRSVKWSQAILQTSRHYIDSAIVPMPCPAEYNFYFTHDVLLTDLAAVKFDINRVKTDLHFIVQHANKQKVIPHAYYWKDSAYTTEFAERDNWNNFWFIIVNAEYLKHSSDTAALALFYPYITKALEQALLTKGEDDLMWSIRPDWWDIGTRYGQRSYMTLLAVRAIRSYLYTSAILGKEDEKLVKYEQLQHKMEAALIQKLWSDKRGFLMSNTDPGVVDEHIYSGSLLAAHYGLLDSAKVSRTISTAREILVDPKVGVSVVYPMDFDKLGDFWHFAGNEVGAKYYYINGGIWPHANAWYALALIAGGMRDSALQFIKNVMSIDGIIDGPNGQPAMYEVRNANHEDPKTYGTIDKPQFMWAAGWYLYSLYSLYGVADNEWNVVFDPYLQEGQKSVEYALTSHNKKIQVKLEHAAKASITYDGVESFSYVIPGKIKQPENIKISIGKQASPYLKTTNSGLESISFANNKMVLQLQAFPGHKNKTIVLCGSKPKSVLVDDLPVAFNYLERKNNSNLQVSFEHSRKSAKVEIQF
ncbi:MAG: hypothetical protein HYV28_06825 [Ignavibacteriales bacterium]|nr:hypothetical protein [Ignavibacteriales bacterium]